MQRRQPSEESPRGGGRATFPLSITACLRCREQKLKCGREHPICSRCDRLNSTCTYPDPPNRRGPRSKRKQRVLNETTSGRHDSTASRKSRPTISGRPEALPNEEQASNLPVLSHASPPRRQAQGQHSALRVDALSGSGTGYTSTILEASSPIIINTYQNQLRRPISHRATSERDSEQCPPLPPTSLGLALLEIYFSRIYNSSLLFHKPVLFQQYLEGKLHRSLLKALLALATLFLQPDSDNGHSATLNPEFRILSVYRSSGLPWAQSAWQEATVLVMQSPSLMAVQALQCIQLYWFGVGEPHKGNLCLALAYRSCQLLGFDKRMSGNVGNPGDSLETELGRRCFWACWTSTCIVMEPEPYINSAWKEVAGLPLPSTISSGSNGYRLSFAESINMDWQSIPVTSAIGSGGPPTASGALIKIIGVWAKIQLFCKNCSLPIGNRDVESVHTFSSLAESLFERAITSRDSAHETETTPETKNLHILHDAIYHQCQIVLHSLKVPLFCGIPSDRNVDVDLQVQMRAAETVLSHAHASEKLLAPFLDNNEDVSRLPPLLGYSAFVVGMIFLSAEVAQRNQAASELPADTSTNRPRLRAVEHIIGLLDTLAVYWIVLEQPREVLRSALRAYVSQPGELLESSSSHNGQRRKGNQGPCPRTARRSFHQSADSDIEPTRSARRCGPTNNDIAHTSTQLIDDTHNTIVTLAEVRDDPFTGDTSLFSDCEWYGMSLAEAGVENLAGFEPSNLFQQGWKMFS